MLLIGETIGEDDDAYKKLIAASREKLKRPWASGPIDFAFLKASLGEKTGAAHNMLALSDQIGPILAGGTRGNPRQIKRFLNSLLLRHEMAEARGFGADVKLPVLAKLMLAERFIPRLFEQIAIASAAHPKGICETVAPLETASASAAAEPAKLAKAARKEDRSEQAPTGSDNPTLTEWLSSQPVLAWAKVEPPLANVDLRPYLFVTKDRKDYFGVGIALGHLAPIVEKLLGPKLAVQRLESELKPLAPNAPTPQLAPSDAFTAARTNFTRYARSGGNDRGSLGRALSSYVSNSTGGARRAARRMGSSRGTAAGLANFLADVGNRGAEVALRALNLQSLAGRPIEDIFLALADYICPEGGTVDEGIARDAFIETIAELAGLGMMDLDSLTPAQLQTVLELYASHAIEARICNDIGSRSITLPPDVGAVERIQAQLKDFIRRGVGDAFARAQADIRALARDHVNAFVDAIYEAAFEILQTLAEAMAES